MEVHMICEQSKQEKYWAVVNFFASLLTFAPWYFWIPWLFLTLWVFPDFPWLPLTVGTMRNVNKCMNAGCDFTNVTNLHGKLKRCDKVCQCCMSVCAYRLWIRQPVLVVRRDAAPILRPVPAFLLQNLCCRRRVDAALTAAAIIPLTV